MITITIFKFFDFGWFWQRLEIDILLAEDMRLSRSIYLICDAIVFARLRLQITMERRGKQINVYC